MQRTYILLLGALALFGCDLEDKEKRAQEIIDASIGAHGGQFLKNATVHFTFRDKKYSVIRRGEQYTYTRTFNDSSGYVQDRLVNGTEFYRTLNGDTLVLTDEWKNRYSNSVNSVLYFMQLPFLLNDPAVNKKYIGKSNIGGEKYHIIKVTFDDQNGGEDFRDQFLFWINASNHMLDYLAYNYSTDGGGARFREAFHRHERAKVTFQDYINYGAPVDVPLVELAEMYELDQLEELSRIENENIQVFRKKIKK